MVDIILIVQFYIKVYFRKFSELMVMLCCHVKMKSLGMKLTELGSQEPG